MRLAYADPPYPGMAKKHYGDHPDFGGEVDHRALVAQLDTFDGWALSTSAAALQEVLALCPPDVRIAAWHRTNSDHPGNRGTWWWSWEPVIVKRARDPEVTTRDVLCLHAPSGFLGGEITGQKPPGFTRWMLSLVGARPGDDVLDLFAGSGAVAREIAAWESSPVLPMFEQVSLGAVPA